MGIEILRKMQATKERMYAAVSLASLAGFCFLELRSSINFKLEYLVADAADVNSPSGLGDISSVHPYTEAAVFI